MDTQVADVAQTIDEVTATIQSEYSSVPDKEVRSPRHEEVTK
jgi:hypothetical protein